MCVYAFMLVRIILLRFLLKLKRFLIYSTNYIVSNLMKITQVFAEFFNTDRQTLIVALRYNAKASKVCQYYGSLGGKQSLKEKKLRCLRT